MIVKTYSNLIKREHTANSRAAVRVFFKYPNRIKVITYKRQGL